MPSMVTRDWRSSWNTFVSPLAGIWLGSLLSRCLGLMAVPVYSEGLPIWDSVHDSGARQEAKPDCHAQPPSLPSPPVPCSIMLNIISSQELISSHAWLHILCPGEALRVSELIRNPWSFRMPNNKTSASTSFPDQIFPHAQRWNPPSKTCLYEINLQVPLAPNSYMPLLPPAMVSSDFSSFCCHSQSRLVEVLARWCQVGRWADMHISSLHSWLSVFHACLSDRLIQHGWAGRQQHRRETQTARLGAQQ